MLPVFSSVAGIKSAQMQALNSVKDNEIPKAAPYPKIEEFQLTPMALGVLKYFYSLPLLLVRIFIDFGYTIGLSFGVSSMHRRSGDLPSVSAAAVSTAGPRIVSPARAPTKTR